MPVITVRKLDANWDPLWGNGQNDYISDGDAVTQIIKQKLLFFQSEWWENRQLGTPMFQSILGANRSIDAVTAIIKNAILSAPYVTGVGNLAVKYVSDDRTYSYSCDAQTPFGTITVSN
jgi:hypothetical protein